MQTTLRILSNLDYLKNATLSQGTSYLMHNSYEVFETIKKVELFSFLKQITKKRDLRNQQFVKKIKPLSKTRFISIEDRQVINNLTGKLMDSIIDDVNIEKVLNFHGFPLLNIDRSAFVTELYHIIESFFAYSMIFEQLKPTKIEILGHLPFFEEKLLRSLCSLKKISLEFQNKSNNFIMKLKNWIQSFQNLLYRQTQKLKNISQLRRITDFSLSSINIRGIKLLVFAFEEVQANSVIPVLKMIYKFDKEIKIIPLSYDRGAVNYPIIASLYNKAGFPIFIGSPLGHAIRSISLNTMLFITPDLSKAIYSLCAREYPNLSPITDVIVNWLLQKLGNRIPVLFSILRVFFYDVKALNPAMLVISNDYNLYSKMMTFVAKKLNIISTLIPHAQFSSHYVISKIETDLLLSSGEHESEYLESSGFAPNNVVMCGTPKYDSTFIDYINSPLKNAKRKDALYKKFALDPSKTLVLITTSDGFETSIRNKYLDSIIQVLKTYDDIEVIIKLHPRDSSTYAYDLIQKHNVHYKILQSFPIFDLLSISKVVFTHISGVAFEAMLFEKPSIEINYTNEKDRFNYHRFNAVIPVTHPNEIKSAFESVVYDEDERKKLLEAQKKLIEYNLFKFDGKSSERAAKTILEKLKT